MRETILGNNIRKVPSVAVGCMRLSEKSKDEMNHFIHQKKKQIKLLEELKYTQIDQYITKGLNPSVSMKDSKVEWIGAIPEHWDVDHIKQHFKVKKRIAGKEGYDVLEKAMDTLIRQMPDEPFVKADWNMPLEKKNEGICCASQIQFVGRTGNYKDAGLPFRGSLLVLQNILNYDYLWIRLRVKGGAYGCMSGFGRDGDCYMVSYLDPKLAETNEVYDKLPEYLEQFDQDERSMDRYVIGAISEMDIPKNPAALGVRGLTAYLSGITREQLQKERDEVIDTDAKEIRALVPYAKAVLSNNCLCVVGNENKIKENSSLFTTVRSL